MKRIGVRRMSIQLSIPFLIFLIIPYFKPGCLDNLAPIISAAFDGWLILAAAIVGVVYILRGRMSKIIFAIALFQLTFMISTAVNKGSVWRCFTLCTKMITFSMLVEMCISQGTKRLIKALILVLGTEVVIDLCTILAYPNGMYKTNEFYAHWENWFLGFRNVHILSILPLLCVFWMYATYRSLSRLVTTVSMVFFALPIYFSWSATSVVGVSVLLIIYFFSEFHLVEKLLEIKKYVLLTLAAFVGFVILKIQEKFSSLIVGILKRSVTFTGRTGVWDRTLSFIKGHPLFGAGVNTLEVDARILNAPHSHDYYLQIMYQSGILGMICFFAIVVIVVKRLKLAEDRRYNMIISSSLFAFFVIFLAEAYGTGTTGFFGIITMAYHINRLTAGLSEGVERKDSSRLVHRNVEKAEQ